MALVCPSCAEDAPDEAKWCEACGQDLNSEPLPICVSCGEREVAEEGYCLSCGHKQPEERDHMEFHDGPIVAVTDRGKRHRHNEDSVAIGVCGNGSAVLVVCDGVSSTPGSAEASLRAATAARDVLVDALDSPPSEVAAGGDGSGPEASHSAMPPIETLLTVAVEAAQAEASASVSGDSDSPYAQGGGPPSSTIVAVVVTPRENGFELNTAWVGDSRAYWIGQESARLSPHDHELAGSLIRWLGADSLDASPDIESTVVAGDGHVVVCSDGMWRYAAEPSELSELISRLQAEGHVGLDLASAMVTFANDGGGHDNISVALWSSSQDAEPAPVEVGAEQSKESLS